MGIFRAGWLVGYPFAMVVVSAPLSQPKISSHLPEDRPDVLAIFRKA